ncbi:electron transport complex subunit D [Clostridia bacterium]|nr:electron transport complex subunit D [Clostridia bacterium]
MSEENKQKSSDTEQESPSVETPVPTETKPEKPSLSLDLSKLLTVTSSPHVRSAESTTALMTDVIIAMIPALIWAIYIFGFRALSLTVISVISAVAAEYLYQKIMKKPVTVSDLSAVVTGILIAFNLPVNVPLLLPIIGSAFAIIIVKQLFGGIGKNIVNPAIAARIFLFLSFSQYMSKYFKVDGIVKKLSPFTIDVMSGPQAAVDAIIGATPLASNAPEIDFFTLFLGQKGGCIGEISILLLLAGGIYLLIRRVITWHIPVSFIGVVAIITFLFPHTPDQVGFMLTQILSGGVVLGAFFMATDYVTSPLTSVGKLIFGAGCGLITIFIRYFGAYPEGVSFSIMIMNLFVWYIDKATKPVKFGGEVKNVAQK